MGRKTFDSIGRPLPRRQNIVLSRSTPATPINGIHYITNLAQLKTEKDIWVIGGSQLYALTLPHTSDLYLTTVKRIIDDGDAFFPPFQESFELKEVIEDNELFSITHYINPKPVVL